MKCQIPQISWHSRDPVLSIDFQPGKRNIQRLASGGTDSHVLIWYITYQENKSIKTECASDLYRHNKSVNVVRFSPNGELLASGDDEGAMFIWQLKERDNADMPKDEENANQEDWFPLKLLRGHLEDIYDISWSSDGNLLVSASMDNTAIIWDMQKFQKTHIYSDSKGYVQGVSWDPLNSFIASIGSDRALRIFNINTKKTVFRVQRAPWTVTTEKGTTRARLFYDDTLKSYFRRLSFTPDGELLIVPSGILERDEEKFQNTTYIFSRHAPNKPVISLPTGDKYTVAVRCNPLLYKLRRPDTENADKENQQPKPKSMIDLPYRMVFAVAACESILLYDTEQLLPFAYVSNIHYTHLTDLTWSADGRILVASSTDGYCSFLIFGEDELGELYVPPEVKEEIKVVNAVNPSDNPVPVPNPAEKKMDAVDVVEKKPLLSEKTEPSCIPEVNLETTVTSLKVDNSPMEATKSKRAKLYTIKNFFKSPKMKPAQSSLTSESPLVEKEAVEMEDPDKPSLSTDDKSSIAVCDVEVKTSKNNVEVMEVDVNDSNSIQLVFDSNNKDLVKSEEKESKGNTQLTLENKTESEKITSGVKAFIKVHLSSENAVSSFDDSLAEVKETVTLDERDETDWKLELSQDDDIVPMEIAPSLPSTSTENPGTPKTPNQKPKRRINLITLSKKTSLTSPKL